MRLPVAIALLATCTRAWAGSAEIKNDHFNIDDPNAMLNFAGNLALGEAVAETFTPDKLAPYYPFRVTGAEFVMGPGGQTRVQFVVYEDTGGVTPGKELVRFTPDGVLEGNTSFLQTVDFPTQPTVSNKTTGIRVALFPETPSAVSGVKFPLDPLSQLSDTSKVYAENSPGNCCRWAYLKDFAMLDPTLKGVWVIRLVIDSDVVPTTGDMRRGDGGGGQPGDLAVQPITPDKGCACDLSAGGGGSAPLSALLWLGLGALMLRRRLGKR